MKWSISLNRLRPSKQGGVRPPQFEWILVLSLLAVMTSLVLVAQVNASRAFSAIEMESGKEEPIVVTVEGAVSKPGAYSVPSGTTVETVLRKARVKPFANLQTIPLHQIIEAPLHLNVEELAEITVSVCGAVVEPLDIVLPARARISDLKSKVSLSKEADKTFFRRRRMLKNGEKIEVPKKDVE